MYIDLRIRRDSHYMVDSLCFRNLNLSKKQNLIRLVDDGVTYSDMSSQFPKPTAIVQKIIKNKNVYEGIDSSVQRRNYITLETKIKAINLIAKKRNISEVS